MRLLILGGTGWLGGYVAGAARRHGDEVTCLARGSSGPVPDGVRFVKADRDRSDAYDLVAAQDWDAVVDVSRQPGQVRIAADLLRERSASFVFISSVSAYRDTDVPGADETAALLPALQGDVMESMQTYGEAKVACEQNVLSAFGPARSCIVRVGLIGGPGDLFDRSGYWPLRFARPATANGAVLIPDAPNLMTQVIDVRDLAEWIVHAARNRLAGVFNATGLPISMAEHLEVARGVAKHTGPTVAVDPDWLQAHGVKPWAGPRSLPLWLPLPKYAGFSARDNSAARANGLATRPLQETLADVLAWEIGRPSTTVRQAGLTDDEEQALLGELASAS